MKLLSIIVLVLLSFSVKAQTVYKTPSGAKYHLASCRMVKNVSEAIDLSKAAELGLDPCKICKPQPLSAKNLPAGKPQGDGNTSQCKGMTKAGNRCRHMTRIGNGYCYQHQPKG